MNRSTKISSTSEGARSKIVALSGILSAVVALLTFLFVPAAIPLGGFDSSSILILSLPILLGPELGTIIICTGEFIGTAFLLAVMGGPLFFLPGIVAVRGPEAYFVGKIARGKFLGGSGGKGRETLAAIMGPIWETVGFIAADYYVYYLMFGLQVAIINTLIVAWTIIDLIWVVPSIAVISSVRKWLNANYMDKQMGLEGEVETKKKLFRISVIFIILTWILLFLVPFVFASWGPPPPSSP
ncbi:MAG: hypothetical protein WED05_01085 [Candidatus Atabeyarchaeum deiterrae]